MIYELRDFIPFIEFILNQDNKILDTPIYGELWIIGPLIQKSSNLRFTSTKDFLDYIIQFNIISGYLLEFSKDLNNNIDIKHLPKLISINFKGVLMLQSRLKGKQTFSQISNSKNHKLPTNLLQILEMLSKRDILPYTSTNSSLSSDLSFDVECLQELIDKPTARTILNKQKALLKTPEKPFHSICSDHNHINLLATVGLNKKEYSHFGSKQTIPVDVIHQRILKCRNILSNDVYKCVQERIHFLPIINNHTDLNLGDCSYLDTCHKLKSCRYLHYYTLTPMKKELSHSSKEEQQQRQIKLKGLEYTIGDCFSESFREPLPPQWINCDVRCLPFSILGKFAAIISDPAWDIHMSLPYGTCKDDELLSLPMHELQDEGIIMLWVTGRSIEIGRRALLKWGYQIYDEMIWIKLNQLRRTIVTGRTGHWLNHSKEHLLVGLKGNPIWINKRIDTDVVVSPTRETSRKPDEFYDIVERLVGTHSRKLEIFGRDHNTRPGWLTIGNQLQGVSLFEPELKYKYELYKQTTTGTTATTSISMSTSGSGGKY